MSSAWARLLAMTAAMILLIFGLTRISVVLLDQYVRVRTEMAATAVAENIRILIDSHVKALQVLGEAEVESKNGGSVPDSMIEATAKMYPGFYAINWMDADGVVRRVYPSEPNRGALGKNLFANPDVATAILISRMERIPVMVPRVKTYQGVEGATLYIPVLSGDRQLGWVNAVLDFQGWLDAYLAKRDEKGLSLRLEWSEGDETSDVYEFGPHLEKFDQPPVKTRILNQNLQISVQMEDVTAWRERRWLGWGLFLAGLILMGFFLTLVRGLSASIRDLTRVNRDLSLKNALVSSLTHDLGNPLTVLMMSVEKMDAEKRFDQGTWERVKKTLTALRSMIDSVRFMHALETGRASLHLTSVDLRKALRESLDQMKESFEVKGIRVVEENPELRPVVRADEATLIHNVLPNLLSNAVKFSRPSGRIFLRVQETAEEVRLSVADEGVGIPPETLRLYFDEGTLASRQGTGGETGSGLGMLQVKTFMKLYRGQFHLESRSQDEAGPGPTGTTATLVFKKGFFPKEGQAK